MSYQDDWPPRQDEGYDRDFGEPPRKPGMSTAMKVLLIILGVSGFFALLCCGGMLWFYSQVELAISEQPADAKAMLDQLVEIDLPAGFQPKGTMSADFLVMQFRIATYERVPAEEGDKEAPPQGALMIGEIDSRIGNNDLRQQQLQLDQALQQQGRDGPNRHLEIHTRKTRKFKIRGEESKFEFAEGEDKKTGEKFRQVSGDFPGKDGRAFLIFQVAEELWNEDEVVKMIESIK